MSTPLADLPDIHPAFLLQQLIRFNTTNPPGNEFDAIQFVNKLLTDADIQTSILAKTPERPNLIARIPGEGTTPPLLLYGHIDVVTTANQKWTHPPFEGVIADNYVWGRGALDMKGGIAMMLAAILGAKHEGITFPGDVILCIMSDEENGGTQGAKFLVENHASLFQNIQHAIGEFGGFTLHIKGRRFYPIMVAEKQMCQLRLTISGPGGHGSIPVRGGAMAKLGHILQRLDKHRLPTHITPITRAMFEQISDALPLFEKLIFKGLLRPPVTNKLLGLLGEQGKIFAPLLQNTVSPTMLQASKAINVIPGSITLDLDGRLLPGFTPQNAISELRSIIGNHAEIDVVQYEPGPEKVDMALFDELTAILKALDKEAIPVPLLLSGVTDGRFFSSLGIQTYGFLPMNLPEGFNFSQTIHTADERIPITALEFGTKSMHYLLCRHFIE